MRDTSLLSRETPEVAGYLSFNGELFVAEATAEDQEFQQAVAQRLEALRTANSESSKLRYMSSQLKTVRRFSRPPEMKMSPSLLGSSSARSWPPSHLTLG